MRERTAGDRIRVAIAGTIYAKRALVRRFLEDDGFAVVAEANDQEGLFSALRSEEPDAVVLDDDIADWDVEEIRRASPDAKIVLFTSGSPSEPGVPGAADGYLQKGVGLGALTSLLRELLAEPVAPIVLPAPPVRVPSGAAHERRVVIRLAALVAALVLIATGALALVGQAPTGRERTLPTIQPTPPPGGTRTALDQAISSMLQPIMGLLGPGILSTLQSILGALPPEIPQPPPLTGGGGIVLPGTGTAGGTVGTGGTGGGGGGAGGSGGGTGGGGGEGE